MTEKRYSLLCGVDENPYEWDIIDNEKNSIITQSNGIAICKALNELDSENKQLKCLLKSMADRNDEIWLDNGQIIRLKRELKGVWVND